MPITDDYERMAIDKIEVRRDSRQRREISTKGLKESIQRIGQLSPIIINHDPESDSFVLVTGERRLQACKELGHESISVRYAADLSATEKEIFELEENAKRSDLPWRDLVRAVARIHELHQSLDPEWNAQKTSEACSLDAATVSIYLKVHSAFDDHFVQQAGTVREAYNLLIRRYRRAAGDALQELLEDEEESQSEDDGIIRIIEPTITDGIVIPPEHRGGPYVPTSSFIQVSTISKDEFSKKFGEQPSLPIPDLEPIRCANFLDFAPTYSGRKFNLIHCDFPYGVNLFSSSGVRSGEARSQMGRADDEGYDDSGETYRALVECLAGNLDRLMSVSGHIMFWYSNKVEIETWTRSTFARLAPNVAWTRFPLIWLKSDNAGIAASPSYEPRHIYETCLLGSAGKRQIVRLVSDAYSAPSDKSIHVSAKPEPMLRHFMTMLVDENTSILDPTCGSGTALRAAESLGAKTILGLERDPKMVEMALKALKIERMKRRAAREF